MEEKELLQLLEKVQAGQLSPQEASDSVLGYENVGFARIDHDRAKRQGFPEVIYGAGKTPEHIVDIARRLCARGAKNVMCTRASQEALALMEKELDAVIYQRARIAIVNQVDEEKTGSVLVMCAGTSDLPVAEEAAVTANVMGAAVTTLYDAGVAGIHRIMTHLEDLRTANVVITVAGMEGALPSVVAGLTDRPIIAVPTSIGYGASFGGLAALLAMLNSCGSGVTVVNIDNGFGAGYSAAMINRLCK